MEQNGNSTDLRDIVIVALLVALPVLWLLFMMPQLLPASQQDVPISQVAARVRAGDVQSITVAGDDLTVRLNNGTTATSRKEPGVPLAAALRTYGATDEQVSRLDVTVAEGSKWSWLASLSWLLPVLLVLGMLLFVGRQSGNSGAHDQTLSFLKSRARRIVANRPRVRYADVAGADEAKEELAEVVEFLKDPGQFAALGARVPRGVLLVGPPGTGKTLLARAVAGEAGVPFFSISGSEFVEMFVGVGASRVRDLFEQAKRNAPCIVFVDEIDAVGRQRGIGFGGGHDEREQTLNQILVEMDGFDQHTNIVVIAATNRADILDPALLRPGRFDRRVTLDSPDVRGRLEILRVHSRDKPMAPGVDLERLARETPGFSGADLENVLNEAAILGVRRGGTRIGMAELEEAVDRVVAGPQRRSRVMTPRERSITAYHEVGHALVAHVLDNVDPVHKVTIVPRGSSGGHTRLLPEGDRSLWTRSQLKDLLAFSLGGLAAEDLVFGETTTGPANDLQQATEMARRMVCEFGMSRELGPVVLRPAPYHEGAEGYSDQTASRIDAEVAALIDEARRRALDVLAARRATLDEVVRTLIERETLQGDELRALLSGGAALDRGDDGHVVKLASGADDEKRAA